LANEDDISQFVRAYIPSVWALEILLLLHADPQRRWLASELLKELRASTTLVNENLSRFERHGLALKDEAGWHFASANFWLRSMADRLSALYRERPMYTMGLIAREDPLHSLAEAFRIKRGEP
jgi:hypothetical protein